MSNSMALPDGSGQVELSEGADGHSALIVCRDRDGAVRWQALPPDGERDSWVSVDVRDDSVVGTSWSCWRVSIDSTTGTEVERHFTK